MSEIIDNSRDRKEKLKELILKLHDGESESKIRKELEASLRQIPYGEVVEVEQELIAEGLPEEEILKLCDAHSSVLQGFVDLSTINAIPDGHPIDVLKKENIELKKVTTRTAETLQKIESDQDGNLQDSLYELQNLFNELSDVDKHYQRKEYLLFPYLETQGITGPPQVMWGRHDQIRELIKGSLEIIQTPDITRKELLASAEIVIEPALAGINEMVPKEEEILFPMALDKLTDADWHEISKQSLDIGYCLYDPPVEWKPSGTAEITINEKQQADNQIRLPSGNFSAEELLSILNTLPLDMTFVDKDDKVKYFSQGAERIFQRSRAILNRDVRNCHPPASAHIVDKIIEDFKSGKEDRAPFWINMGGKMIHIAYFALRDDRGDYLGTLEVSHDVSRYRELEGEQRILSYGK